MTLLGVTKCFFILPVAGSVVSYRFLRHPAALLQYVSVKKATCRDGLRVGGGIDSAYRCLSLCSAATKDLDDWIRSDHAQLSTETYIVQY